MQGLLSNVRKFGRTMFGYDAVAPKNRRRAPTGINRSEDDELTPEQRRKLVSGTRDLTRNFAVAAWAVRRHLDYVSTFTFQAKSGNEKLDIKLEGLMANWSKRQNCEVTKRHSLPAVIRGLERRRLIDGDVFPVKIADGRLQVLEGDRVRTPTGGLPTDIKATDLVQGVKLDAYGAAEAYAVCKRDGSSFKFERMLSADNVFHHFYSDRFDQVRGISPLAAAVATFQDTYESLGYAVSKLKVEQMVALALFRDSSDEIGQNETDEETGETIKTMGSEPISLDLDRGDKAEFLESKNPSKNTQEFIQVLIQIALKAVDIPYSFYAENFSNYSGSRQAMLQYEQSANIKRQDNRELLDDITEWKIQLWVEDGLLTEEEAAAANWDWIPAGLPWIDPLKEISAQQKAVALRVDTRTAICRRQGRVFRDVIDELAAEEAYMASKGVAVTADVEVQKIETESTSIVEDKPETEEPLDASQQPDE
jgi:capsid protein